MSETNTMGQVAPWISRISKPKPGIDLVYFCDGSETIIDPGCYYIQPIYRISGSSGNMIDKTFADDKITKENPPKTPF
jgi:hypothetical protein